MQHLQQTPLQWMTYFGIVSRNCCVKMLYMKIVPRLSMKQQNQHSPCAEICNNSLQF